jgi:hypothetical protein
MRKELRDTAVAPSPESPGEDIGFHYERGFELTIRNSREPD